MKALATLLLLAATLSAQTTYYVSTSGDDSHNGSVNQPWKTIDHAIGTVSSGDTIYVEDGTYTENPMTISGSDDDLTIAGNPNNTSRPVIRCGQVFTSGWAADETYTNCYSRADFTAGSGRPYAYLEDPDTGYRLEKMGLIVYTDISDLNASSETWHASNPYYCGPGVCLDGGTLYIRLDKTDEMDDYETDFGTVLSSANPNDYSINVCAETYVFRVYADNVTFQDLEIEQAQNPIDFKNTSTHSVTSFTVDTCKIWLGDTCIEADERTTGDNFDINADILDCEFLGDNPGWLTWGDAKATINPAATAHRQSSIQFGDLKVGTVLIDSCFFHGGHDGISMTGNNVKVARCCFDNMHDDCIEIEGEYEDFEIEECYFNNSFVAVSVGQDVAASSEVGPALIHHCIYSSFNPIKVERDPLQITWNNETYWSEYAFKIHEGVGVSIYNCTIAMMDYQNDAYGISKPVANTSDGDADDTMLNNNVFICINDVCNREYDPDYAQSNHKIDGNLYWRPGQSGTYNIAYVDTTAYTGFPITDNSVNFESTANSYAFDESSETYDLFSLGSALAFRPDATYGYTLTGSAPSAAIDIVEWEPKHFTPGSNSVLLSTTGASAITVTGVTFFDYSTTRGAIASATTPAFWTVFPFDQL